MKSIEVVKDVLITVYTEKEGSDKKEKIKECVKKINENKENATQMYQN